MDAIYLEETIDMMKECLKRMESIREGEIENDCVHDNSGSYGNDPYCVHCGEFEFEQKGNK